MTLPTHASAGGHRRPRGARRAGLSVLRSALPFAAGAACVVLLLGAPPSLDLGRGWPALSATLGARMGAGAGMGMGVDMGAAPPPVSASASAPQQFARSLLEVPSVAYRPMGREVEVPPASARAGGGGAGRTVLRVFQPVEARDGPAYRRAAALVGAGGGGVAVEHVAATPDERRDLVARLGGECYRSRGGGGGGGGAGAGGNAALVRYDSLLSSGHSHLADELWKYCALSASGGAGAYLDGGFDAALLSTFRDAFLPAGAGTGTGGPAVRNVAVLGDARVPLTRGTVHGAVLVLDGSDESKQVADGMVRLLVDADSGGLVADPTLVPGELHRLIAGQVGADGPLAPGEHPAPRGGRAGAPWSLFGHRCHVEGLADLIGGGSGGRGGAGATHVCPPAAGFCCDVTDPALDAVVMVTRHPLLPYQLLPAPSSFPRPYRWDKLGEAGRPGGGAEAAEVAAVSSAPHRATLREELFDRPDKMSSTPNFFEILLSNDCLPTDRTCSLCLKQKSGATCKSCAKACPCYCNALCETHVEEKFLSKKVRVTPPTYRKDPSRLIPRIVHQTWFEDVTKDKYPNMSRLIESWKRSGWEYRFYSDDAASEFLSLHFPPEVKEAYDAILPGAFKADLFRYCALLVDGGVYADMDVLLETNLDAAVPADVGFMVPVDEPGMVAGHRMCLWNGLIASAPGHPFLAQTIENVVNNVRNRFTSVDTDNTLCPNPEISVAHSFDILFTAGPCMLGSSINKLLGLHPQTSYEAGTIDIWGQGQRGPSGDIKEDDPRLGIPGRAIILKQDKWDMGAHRFTWEEENLVVAATDMPDYDDRENLSGEDEDKKAHYSETHVKLGVYGLDKLYTDRVIANERIEISVGGPSKDLVSIQR